MAKVVLKKQKLSNGSAKTVKNGVESKKKDGKVTINEQPTSSASEESEESEVSEEESHSEEESDDEPDLADVSSANDSGSDSESNSESDFDTDSDSDIPKKKKSSKDDGSSSFSTAVSAILGSKLKKHDRDDPILVRSKQKIKKFEEDKLELKARRLINQERKLKLNANRVRDLLPKEDSKARLVLLQEKAYKKVAQRGVIKLFNAVLLTQTASQKQISGEKVLGVDKREELINEISKEKFLDLVQNADK